MGFIITFAVITLIATIAALIAASTKHSYAAQQDSEGAAVAGAFKVGIWVVYGVFLVVFVLVRSMHSISAGELGIVKTFGNITGTKSPGFVVIAPWETIDSIGIRVQRDTVEMDDERKPGSGSAVTRDNQAVYATVTLNYQVDARRAIELYRTVGGNFKEVLIDPRVPQAFKAVTAHFRATRIAANRDLIRRLTKTSLDKQLDAEGIHVTDFLINNIHFTPEFQKALEDTQVAAQRAKQEEQRVKIEEAKARQREARALGVANSTRIEAKGQADANRLIGASLSENVIAFQAVQKLEPGVKTVVVPAGSPFLLPPGLFGKG